MINGERKRDRDGEGRWGYEHNRITRGAEEGHSAAVRKSLSRTAKDCQRVSVGCVVLAGKSPFSPPGLSKA